MSLSRALRHLFAPPWLLGRALPADAMDRIERVVTESERRHRGEVRFAVEGALDFFPVLRGLTARERAVEVFSLSRVWDTEENTGVLLYLQLVDHDVEIVADRGIAKLVSQDDWEGVCRRMEASFAAGRFEAGVIAGIGELTALLARHFPADAGNVDELPDRPIVL